MKNTIWRAPFQALVAVALTVGTWGMPRLGQAQELLLGQIGPFTVLPAPVATEVNQGARAWVAQVNKREGAAVAGRKLSLVEVDDRYNPEDFVARFNEMVQQRRPVALLSPIGSATVKRVLDDKLLDRGEVLIMGAIPGTESLRDPGHPLLFHIGAGDKQQIEKIVNHVRTLGIERMSVLYQNIPMGTSGLKVATDEAARTKGLTVLGVQTTPDATAMAAASQAVLKQSPQGVLTIGSPRFMSDAVLHLRRAGVSQAIFALSYATTSMVVKVAGVELARGVAIAQTYPNPNGKVLPLLRHFQSAMKAAYPDVKEYTEAHLEGYVGARILTEAMRRTKGDYSAENLARTLHNMGELDFEGFRVDFSRGNIGSRFVDIGVIGSDGRLHY